MPSTRTKQVRAILEQGGWAAIGIRPLDVPCALPAAALPDFFSRLGPVGVLLKEVDEPTRRQVIDAVRAAFEPFVHGSEVAPPRPAG